MSQLLKISLPDGSVREMAGGSTPADVAAAAVAAVQAGIMPRGLAMKAAKKLGRIADATVQALRDVKVERDPTGDATDEN